eukprot:2347522-Amphidinium_carterae.1
MNERMKEFVLEQLLELLAMVPWQVFFVRQEPARETEGHVLSETLGGEVSQRRIALASQCERYHALLACNLFCLKGTCDVPVMKPSQHGRFPCNRALH